MNDLSHLQNFPFHNLEELSFAFNSGTAEPVVPKEFAKDWVLNSPLSRTRKTATILYGVPVFMYAGIIAFSNYNTNVTWYHGLGAAMFSVFVFSNYGRSSLGVFRKILSYAFIALTFYFFITRHNDFGILCLLSLGTLFFWELTYFIALKEIVSVLLINKTFLEEMWNKKMVFIRFNDGKVVSIDSSFNLRS